MKQEKVAAQSGRNVAAQRMPVPGQEWPEHRRQGAFLAMNL